MPSFFIAAVAFVIAVSCDRIPGVRPATPSIIKSDYNSTAEELEQQMDGLYRIFQNDSLWIGSMPEYFQTASGLMVWGKQRISSEWLDGMYLTKFASSISGNYYIWKELVKGIGKCNFLLSVLPDSPVDEAYKLEIEAEARFIRAVLNFTGVRIWGDFPLLNKFNRSDTDTYEHPARAPFYQVYAFILDDLLFAEENMRDKARVEVVHPGGGRLDKWAATAMKASVYLTIGSLLSDMTTNFWDSARTPDFSPCHIMKAEDAFERAAEASEEVINQGPYELAPDYRKLFCWDDTDNRSLKEQIFVIKVIRQTELSIRQHGIDAERVRPTRFLVDSFISHSANDPRYTVTFLDSYVDKATGKTVNTYPDSGSLTDTSSPYIRKYMRPGDNVSDGYGDFYLMRYAEMYLIAAESYASLSRSPGDAYWHKAIEYVNVLRARARHSTDGDPSLFPADWDSETFASNDDLIDAIIWERFIEMSGEGHEWFDTHRRGAKWLSRNIAVPANRFYMLDDNMAAYREYFYLCHDQERIFPESVNDLRKSLLCAYPEVELAVSAQYNTQNDFYWK